MKERLLFVDAETDGLYGQFLSVAMLVTDLSGENILEEAYWGVKNAKQLAQDSWTREHVIPIMGDYEPCENEEELLEKMWSFWMKYQETAYAIADVSYPVEARLFAKCVEKEMETRKYQAPFPLLDLSTLLYWEGLDPVGNRTHYIAAKVETVHNALYDVKMSAAIWRKLRKEKERV